MILNRNFYNQIFFLKAAFYRKKAKALIRDSLESRKLFKLFRLTSTEWPNKIYDYSPRLKRVPVFIADKKTLNSWPERKSLEDVCPTGAITVTHDAIIIEPRGCIVCSLCIEAAPEGLLEVPTELTKFQ